jgi:small subunit ribosomal protein S6
MNTYELTVVYGGKLTPAKAKTFIEKTTKLIETFDGKVVGTINWGEKELAYQIKKQNTGYFVIFLIEMEALSVKNINDKLRVDEGLLRYLLIKTDGHRQIK